MDDLLIITRRTLDKHLQKMETVLTRLRDAGLKVNAAKSLFCAHEIEYLRYILTREGIKPLSNKVQAILALNPPNNVKELRHFLRTVQYYRDMWCWVRYTRSGNYEARGASGDYKARGASGNYEAWGASGGKYEA